MKTNLFLLSFLLLAGCGPITRNGSTPTIQLKPGSSTPGNSPSATPIAGNPTTQAASLPTGTTTTPLPAWSYILSSPVDGQVVGQPVVEVKGSTNLDAVLTINDEVHLLSGGMEFTIPVTLVEGPNSLEIIASNYGGQEIDQILVVTYQP